MNILIMLMAIILLTACETKQQAPAEQPMKPTVSTLLQDLLDSNNVSGCIAVFDSSKNVLLCNNVDLLNTGHLPASTYKIVNTLIGLETGTITADHVFRWDGAPRAMPAWERDLTLAEAFKVSCVPCYQELARSIGTEKMQKWVDAFNYGSIVINDSTLDIFWLQGASTISPMQQIDFLRRLHDKQLPITEQTHAAMMNVMSIMATNDGTLYGKTGWAIRDGSDIGWFVGWMQSATNVRYVAVCIQPKPGFDMGGWTATRRQLAELALQLTKGQ